MNPGSPTISAHAPRNSYIDTLRGWSIFGVICVHFAGSFVTSDDFAWSPSFYVGLTLNQVFGFAVPLFIFLSGLLAGSSQKPITLGAYYHSRWWRIGFPYLLASTASFFLLNHYASWLALPDFHARWVWLLQHFFFYGVEPTLYFIPLILQLYVLQPALKSLPRWLNRMAPAMSVEYSTIAITRLLLALHIIIGLLCYRGTLDYYVWGRPNALFWMFYFFAGLHFKNLTVLLTSRRLKIAGSIAITVAIGAMVWNGLELTDPGLMGIKFELNRLDFAYVRPQMLIYDLAMVIALAAGVALGWTPRPGPFSYLGRYTLEIYLWHILVLYYGAWRYADALASCRQVPELIILICAATALGIAVVTDGLSRMRAYMQHHRIVVVEVE